MNCILLTPDDFISPTQARLQGRRLDHIQTVLNAKVGDQLTAGNINGNIGKAELVTLNSQEAILDIKTPFTQAPPPALPITLIIALPRPKMLKRILQTCTTMGVKKIIFINSYKVDKSYWQTPLLKDAAIKEQLLLGLEQAKDTVLPKVILKKRFKPFVEDELSNISQGTIKLIAHPTSSTPCPVGLTEPITLLIGPEGGFIDYEVNKVMELGFKGITLGERILRTETAVPVLLAKLIHM